MMEKVKSNILTFCAEWFVVSVIYSILGEAEGFLDLVSAGFFLSCVLWVPVKVYVSPVTIGDGSFVVVNEFDQSVERRGLLPAALSFGGIVLLAMFLQSVFGELAAGVILALLFIASFFIL